MIPPGRLANSPSAAFVSIFAMSFPCLGSNSFSSKLTLILNGTEEATNIQRFYYLTSRFYHH